MAECGCGKGKGGIGKYSGGGPSFGYKGQGGPGANYGPASKYVSAIGRYTPPRGNMGNYNLGEAMARYERPLPIFAALHKADGFDIGPGNSKQRYSRPMTRPAYAYDPLAELENRKKRLQN